MLVFYTIQQGPVFAFLFYFDKQHCHSAQRVDQYHLDGVSISTGTCVKNTSNYTLSKSLAISSRPRKLSLVLQEKEKKLAFYVPFFILYLELSLHKLNSSNTAIKMTIPMTVAGQETTTEHKSVFHPGIKPPKQGLRGTFSSVISTAPFCSLILSYLP